MKTETYNGIDIFLNPSTRNYFTKVLLYNRMNNRGRAYVISSRLARVKEEIDLFIQRSIAKKNKKFVFVKGSRSDKGYYKAQVLLFDKVSNSITVMDSHKRVNTYALSDYKFNTDKVFLDTRMNRIMIDNMNLCNAEIIKQKKLISEHQGKLVAVKSKNDFY